MNDTLLQDAINRWETGYMTHDQRFQLATYFLQGYIPQEELADFIKFLENDIKLYIIKINYSIKSMEEVYGLLSNVEELTQIERFIGAYKLVRQVIEEAEMTELLFYLRTELNKILVSKEC